MAGGELMGSGCIVMRGKVFPAGCQGSAAVARSMWGRTLLGNNNLRPALMAIMKYSGEKHGGLHLTAIW